jgi:hypothetical protein
MPVAVYFICCDAIHPSPSNSIRVNLIGLLGQIRSGAVPPYPHTRQFLSKYLLLAEPDAAMMFTIQIVRADTGRPSAPPGLS